MIVIFMDIDLEQRYVLTCTNWNFEYKWIAFVILVIIKTSHKICIYLYNNSDLQTFTNKLLVTMHWIIRKSVSIEIWTWSWWYNMRKLEIYIYRLFTVITGNINKITLENDYLQNNYNKWFTKIIWWMKRICDRKSLLYCELYLLDVFHVMARYKSRMTNLTISFCLFLKMNRLW